MELSFCYVAFHRSPVIEKSVLEEEIANAIMRTEQENVDVVKTLKLYWYGIGRKRWSGHTNPNHRDRCGAESHDQCDIR